MRDFQDRHRLQKTICQKGFFTDLHRISEVVDQELFVETNGDFIKITEVMVKFEEDRAYSRACTDG